ncbi:hypothetical protein HNQ50_003617 [Silvimonas terrae]|uniref:DUF1484 family protein n=1 Tax=Silvimonas terrae TaxID=300266 RepID=A0A840RKY7_9NEIS|nr:hypothetical protein [Silvimonas terrae]MBB5192863.1 hypothetical protein [Silvimonas terrae]
MNAFPLAPFTFALRKALTLEAMQQAADSGQTTLVSTLLALDEHCDGMDAAVMQQTHHLNQLIEAMDMLFTALDQAIPSSLSIEAVRHLLEPIRHQIQNVHNGLDALH